MKHLLVTVATVGLLASACARSAPSGLPGRVVPLDGKIQMLEEGKWEPVSETLDLERGARIRAGQGGRARIDLPGQRSLELAPQTEVRLPRADAPELLAGSVLAQAGSPMDISVNRTTVVAQDGMIRIDSAFSVRVAVYRGSATLPGTGWSTPLTSLQQIGVTAGVVTRAPRPIEVDATNIWDLRLMGQAIDIGSGLFRQETGLTAQLTGPDVSAAILDVLADSLPAAELTSLLEVFAPAEVVIAALIATTSERADPSTTLQEILALRTAGAAWIVIAEAFGLDRGVLGSITQFAGKVAAEVRQRGDERAERARSGAATRGRSGAASGGGGGGSAGTGSSGGGGGGGGGGKNGGGGPGPTDPSCSGELACAIESVIGDGGLGLP